MEIIYGNWTQNNGWDPVQMEQKKENESAITSGRDFQLKTRVFNLYDYKGDLFPERSRVGALASDVAYGLAAVPHAFVTGLGNVCVGLKNLASACKDVYEKRSETGFSYKATFTPVGEQFFSAARKGILALGVWYFNDYNIKFLEWNAAKTIGIASLTLWTLYSAYNPLGAMYRVSQAERVLNVRPLTDGQVSDLTWPKTFEHILDGSYSLSRLLNIHYVGNVSDKVGEERRAFVKVDGKKQR